MFLRLTIKGVNPVPRNLVKEEIRKRQDPKLRAGDKNPLRTNIVGEKKHTFNISLL